MRVQRLAGSFVLCVEDGGMEDLEVRKIYQVLPDREASREGYVRVVDESDEDYLYPSDLFVPVKLPAAVVRRLRARTAAKTQTSRRSIRRAGWGVRHLKQSPWSARALLFQHFPNRKVLVLREDDRAHLDGSIPNCAVICALEAEIEDVCGEMSRPFSHFASAGGSWALTKNCIKFPVARGGRSA
jgi:hypothetical protein